MLETLHTIFGDYYGLDWAVLILGVVSNTLMTSGNLRIGMRFSCVSSIFGLIVAVMAHQYGFVIYNAIIIGLTTRGMMRGDRRGVVRELVQVANSNVTPQDVPVRAYAQ